MKRVWPVAGVALLAGVVADLLVGADLPGFIAAFSFVGCIVIIIGSKRLGKLLLQRREDYYGGPADA